MEDIFVSLSMSRIKRHRISTFPNTGIAVFDILVKVDSVSLKILWPESCNVLGG